MVTTADRHEDTRETFDVFTRGRVLAVVTMFVSMLAVSYREDVVSSVESRLAMWRSSPVDTGWVTVNGLRRAAVHPDSVQRTGPSSYLLVIRYRLAATYRVFAREEVDCGRRRLRTLQSRRQGIRNDISSFPNARWSGGDELTQRKVAFLCALIARRVV